MEGVLALIAALAPLCQDESAIVDLIRRLETGDIVERDDAERRLVALGPKAAAALKGLPLPADPEARARLDGILREIERRERLKSTWPSKLRGGVDLRDVTLREAFRATFGGFGLGSVQFGARGRDGLTEEEAARRMSLRLGEVSFWEATDAFCRAAGWNQGLPAREGAAITMDANVRPAAFVDLAPVRLYADSFADGGKLCLRLGAGLPPRCPVRSVVVEGVTVQGVTEDELSATGAQYVGQDVAQTRWHLATLNIWEGRVGREHSEARVRIEGTLVLRVIRECVRQEFTIEEGAAPVVDLWKAGPKIRLLGWVEDSASGERVGDLGTMEVEGPEPRRAALSWHPTGGVNAPVRIRLEGSTRTGAHGHSVLNSEFRAGQRVVVLLVTEEAESRRPFSIEVEVAK